MAVKVTKGQICDGTISKHKCHQEYYLCGKFHAFYEKAHDFWVLPLYYDISGGTSERKRIAINGYVLAIKKILLIYKFPLYKNGWYSQRTFHLAENMDAKDVYGKILMLGD